MPAVRSKDQSERKSVQLPCGTLSLSSVQVGRLVGQVVTSSIYHTEKTKGKRQQGVKTTKTRQDKTMVEEPLKVTTPHSTGVRQASLCGGKEGREKLCGVCVVCVLCVWLNQWNQARDAISTRSMAGHLSSVAGRMSQQAGPPLLFSSVKKR